MPYSGDPKLWNFGKSLTTIKPGFVCGSRETDLWLFHLAVWGNSKSIGQWNGQILGSEMGIFM